MMIYLSAIIIINHRLKMHLLCLPENQSPDLGKDGRWLYANAVLRNWAKCPVEVSLSRRPRWCHSSVGLRNVHKNCCCAGQRRVFVPGANRLHTKSYEWCIPLLLFSMWKKLNRIPTWECRPWPVGSQFNGQVNPLWGWSKFWKTYPRYWTYFGDRVQHLGCTL